MKHSIRKSIFVGLLLFNSPILNANEPKATPPRDALKTFTIADGLEMRLVASEPLIRQPLSISFDDRGRMWLLQYIQYPNPEGLKPVAVDEYLRTKYDRRPDPPPKGPRGHDIIAILEDTNGDGVMDRARPFLTGLNLASGMALGYGGVFVVQPPYLLFYRDANGDDIPDGDPEVLLTGFGMEDAHAFANSLTWGPDGWLYGAQGSTVTANIRGIEFQQGIWRYHPRTKEFELFAEGGGNTWGIDFDRVGNLFAGGNTYEPLCHHVQGAYYVKGFGKHGPLHNPYAFGYFDPVKHIGPFGGGLTGGFTIYQGGAFPARFDNAVIAPNMRQNAVRWYTFEKRGSTFATKQGGQGGDFAVSSDRWFRPVDTTVGPDGAFYIADWYDLNLSHTNPKDRSQWYTPSRDDGRIWRVAAKGEKPFEKPFEKPRTPLNQLASTDVAALLNHPNEWYRREAWRILGERRDASLVPALKQKFAAASDEVSALEAFWAIHLSGGFDDAFAERALGHPAEYVRAWTVRLLGDAQHVSSKMSSALLRLAKSDPSVIVRSQLACTAKRLPAHDALPIAAALVEHDEDAADPNVPLLIWWAVESKAASDRDAVLALLDRPQTWQRPIVRDVLVERLARRYMALGANGGYAACAWLLQHAPQPADAARIVAGMETQLAGHHFDHPPEPLDRPLANLLSAPAPSTELLCLALRLGSQPALPKLLDRAKDANTKQNERLTAIRALSEAGPPQTAGQLLALLDRRESDAIAEAVLTAVGRFKDESLGTKLLALWPSLSGKLRDRGIDILVSRPAWSRQLLKAVAAKRVDPKSLSTDELRHMLLHGDAEIAREVAAHWGSIRTTTPREKEGKIKAVSIYLSRGTGDAASGRQLFVRHCAICHRLYGEGNQIGPDLTAADRKNLSVLLPNVVDPSGVIRPEFRAYHVLLDDGRILTGLLADQNESTVTVLDAKNQRTVVKRSNIEELKASDVSLMPDNVLEPLGEQEIRDLFAYVRGTQR